jgi:RNA polymerase sigma-70 factor (ECF subfamily)
MTASAPLDRQDVHRVLAGDVDAFSGIVRRWQSPLVNLAYRFCRDRGQAEEMAQEAFLRAFQRLDQWREDAAFSTWLFAMSAFQNSVTALLYQAARLGTVGHVSSNPDPDR